MAVITYSYQNFISSMLMKGIPDKKVKDTIFECASFECVFAITILIIGVACYISRKYLPFMSHQMQPANNIKVYTEPYHAILVHGIVQRN